jgi:Holliday junction resolvase RusA-like endonuclease
MGNLTINELMEMTIREEKIISFVSVANPPVQARHCSQPVNKNKPMLYNPSKPRKQAFAAVIKTKLIAHHTTQFPVFHKESLAKSKGIKLNCNFFLPRIQVDYCVINRQRVLIPHPQPYPKQNDIDNMVKFVCDAMQHVLYANDDCVCRLLSTKPFVPEDITDGSPEQTGYTKFTF